jgi:hypothetical protein
MWCVRNWSGSKITQTTAGMLVTLSNQLSLTSFTSLLLMEKRETAVRAVCQSLPLGALTPSQNLCCWSHRRRKRRVCPAITFRYHKGPVQNSRTQSSKCRCYSIYILHIRIPLITYHFISFCMTTAGRP